MVFILNILENGKVLLRVEDITQKNLSFTQSVVHVCEYTIVHITFVSPTILNCSLFVGARLEWLVHMVVATSKQSEVKCYV